MLSIIEKLFNLMGEKIEEYISFFSLRTHGIIKAIPFVEITNVYSNLRYNRLVQRTLMKGHFLDPGILN